VKSIYRQIPHDLIRHSRLWNSTNDATRWGGHGHPIDSKKWSQSRRVVIAGICRLEKIHCRARYRGVPVGQLGSISRPAICSLTAGSDAPAAPTTRRPWAPRHDSTSRATTAARWSAQSHLADANVIGGNHRTHRHRRIGETSDKREMVHSDTTRPVVHVSNAAIGILLALPIAGHKATRINHRGASVCGCGRLEQRGCWRKERDSRNKETRRGAVHGHSPC
jgi:hypothetical protein